MPRMGDMWYEALRKLNNGEQLSNEELEAIRFAGNNTQVTNDLVNGWQNGVVSPEFAIRAVEQQQHGARVNNGAGAGQSIPNDTATAVQFDTVVFQSGPYGIDLSADNTSIYIPEKGLYAVNFDSAFASNATGLRYSRSYLNTSAHFYFSITSGAVSSLSGGTQYWRLSKGNQVQIYVYQNSTGALNLLNTAILTIMKVLSPKTF